jgi:hypothetical protein
MSAQRWDHQSTAALASAGTSSFKGGDGVRGGVSCAAALALFNRSQRTIWPAVCESAARRSRWGSHGQECRRSKRVAMVHRPIWLGPGRSKALQVRSRQGATRALSRRSGAEVACQEASGSAPTEPKWRRARAMRPEAVAEIVQTVALGNCFTATSRVRCRGGLQIASSIDDATRVPTPKQPASPL